MKMGKKSGQKKDQAIYVGITNPTNRSGVSEKFGEKTEEKDKKGQKTAEGAKQ